MRKIFTLLTLVVIMAVSQLQNAQAQSPQKMSYQAVIRNSSDKLVTSKTVGMKISILQGSATGTAVYTETQTPSTNANGLVSIEIGGGTGFDLIDWSNGPFFIKTETDPTGSTNYTITGTSQLLSVPYALYAASSGNGIPDGINAGNTPYWNGTKWITNSSNLFNNGGNVGIGTSKPNAALQFANIASPRKIVFWEQENNDHQVDAIGVQGGLEFHNANTIDGFKFLAGTSSTSSKELMSILGNGNIGIGTTTPETNLQLGDYNTASDQYLTIATQGGNYWSSGIKFRHYNNKSGWTIENDERTQYSYGLLFRSNDNDSIGKVNVAFLTNGRVGIGITNPDAPLSFDGTGQKIHFLNSQADGYSIGVETSELRIAGGTGNIDAITFKTQGYNGTERMRIDGSGNVGIGTSSPSYALHIGSDKIIRLEGYTSTSTANAFSVGAYGAFGLDKPNVSNGRFVVTTSGNVGIGVPSPDAPLTFDGTGQKIHFYNSQTDGYSIGVEASELRIAGGTANIDAITFKTQGYNGTERMRINGSGNVGIGTTNPTTKLDINGDAIKIRNSSTINSSNSDGYTGEIRWDSNYLYICINGDGPGNKADTWKRSGFSNWPVSIGDSFQGGMVFYILQPGDLGYNPNQQHGLIASFTDLSSSKWGCTGTLISGADGTAIGTGNQNTMDIEASCTTAGTPADQCANLTLNGYSDWYLPSQDELIKLNDKKNIIGGFSSGYYWSSSEIDATHAVDIPFYMSTGTNHHKDNSFYVRAIRTF